MIPRLPCWQDQLSLAFHPHNHRLARPAEYTCSKAKDHLSTQEKLMFIERPIDTSVSLQLPAINQSEIFHYKWLYPSDTLCGTKHLIMTDVEIPYQTSSAGKEFKTTIHYSILMRVHDT